MNLLRQKIIWKYMIVQYIKSLFHLHKFSVLKIYNIQQRILRNCPAFKLALIFLRKQDIPKMKLFENRTLFKNTLMNIVYLHANTSEGELMVWFIE